MYAPIKGDSLLHPARAYDTICFANDEIFAPVGGVMVHGKLYRILEWARTEGNVAALSRMRVILLPLTVRERIVLDRVGNDTKCSPEYLEAARKAASVAVGKECPL